MTIEYAMSVIRSEMRYKGINPENCNANKAHQVLDDICKGLSKEHEFKKWYLEASQSSIKKFYREWEKWRKLHNEMS